MVDPPLDCPVHWLCATTRVLLKRIDALEKRLLTGSSWLSMDSEPFFPKYPPGVHVREVHPHGLRAPVRPDTADEQFAEVLRSLMYDAKTFPAETVSDDETFDIPDNIVSNYDVMHEVFEDKIFDTPDFLVPVIEVPDDVLGAACCDTTNSKNFHTDTSDDMAQEKFEFDELCRDLRCLRMRTYTDVLEALYNHNVEISDDDDFVALDVDPVDTLRRKREKKKKKKKKLKFDSEEGTVYDDGYYEELAEQAFIESHGLDAWDKFCLGS